MGFGIVALRALVGALFIGHGLQKLAGWFGGHGLEGTAAAFDQMGMRPGRRHALAAGLSETAGGLSLVTGFLTPLGTSAVTGTMAVAIAKVHGSKGLWNTGGGYEYNLVLGAAAFAIAAEGPGSLSLDARLGTRVVRPRRRRPPSWPQASSGPPRSCRRPRAQTRGGRRAAGRRERRPRGLRTPARRATAATPTARARRRATSSGAGPASARLRCQRSSPR